MAKFGTLLGVLFITTSVSGRGLLLLYRPRDISSDCAISRNLRFDVSYGGGMSDTITLVLRTMSEIDYACEIEIVTEKYQEGNPILVVVFRFPNAFEVICEHNPNNIIILKKTKCYYLCKEIEERFFNSSFYATTVQTRIRFKFISNSSINSDLNAHLYEVTATSGRRLDENEKCNIASETACIIKGDMYCITSAVVCDGIKNCGAENWFDERQSDCEAPVQRLALTPVGAVATMVLCFILVFVHILRHCLPPLAASFFIFNTNEDNRLCIDPLFESPDRGSFDARNAYSTRKSIIPVDLSSTSSDTDTDNVVIMTKPPPEEKIVDVQELGSTLNLHGSAASTGTHAQLQGCMNKKKGKKVSITTVSKRIQRRLQMVTNRIPSVGMETTTSAADTPEKITFNFVADI